MATSINVFTASGQREIPFISPLPYDQARRWMNLTNSGEEG